MVIGFTRRMASAGYAYTYASRSLGKERGFMAGWLYFFGIICFVPMTMSGVGYLAANLLGLNPGWWILFFFIGMALFLVLSIDQDQGHHPGAADRRHRHRGHHRDRRPGHHRQGRQPRPGAVGVHLRAHPVSGGFNGVFYGIILGVTSYIGFETAADFGEETANPRRYIPIAVIAATVFAVVFYLWTTYSITIGFGVKNGADVRAPTRSRCKTTATTFVGSWLGTLVEIGGMCSAFIVCVACATAAVADAVRDGPRGRAARGVRPHLTRGSRRRSTRRWRWPRSPP